MDTCYKLSLLCKEKGLDIKVMGVPKTVDNDLAITDHSLGFGSAAKYVVNTTKEIILDAVCYKKGKVYIIEVMGRNAGWLTAAVDLLPEEARPDLIYLPENKFDIEEFLKDVEEVHKRKGVGIIVISEGVKFERDMKNAQVDAFGHAQLAGACTELAHIVESRLGIKTRVVELSLLQRANPFLLSRNDRDEAIEVGQLAVTSALAGETGKMIVMKRVSNEPYVARFELVSLSEVANAEQKVPEYMMQDKHRMSDKFREYLRPLIQGNIHLIWKDGIVELTNFKKKIVK
jgi:6-phosphofructokinase 1